MKTLPKLSAGDKVAIVSPSFVAPAVWPHVYELGLERVREVFGLEPVAFPMAAKLDATPKERATDLVAAFEDAEIKGVISTIGGDDQVTYVKNLPSEPFVNNPKPFFGFSDNSHFCNFLFLNGVPSFYGGALFTQFAMQGEMNPYTVAHIKHALFESGEKQLAPADAYTDVDLDWGDESLLTARRSYEPSAGWYWDGEADATGVLWGGCVEAVDEMLRHNTPIPSREQFERIVLMLETSEEIPPAHYVFRVLRALGERGILSRIQGVLVGRPKAWGFETQRTLEEKKEYRAEQREALLRAVRMYNPNIPVVQNLDFGHTEPQIPMPYGNTVRVDTAQRCIYATF